MHGVLAATLLAFLVPASAAGTAALLLRVPATAGILGATGPDRIPGLDGLRALLALSVLACHGINTQHALRYQGDWFLPSGMLETFAGDGAVAVFFMITAFLFWSRVVRDDRRMEIRRLYASRFRRLAPAFFASTALVLLIDAALSGFRMREPAAALALHTAQQLTPFFFGPPGAHPWNGLDWPTMPNAGVTWSLSYEVVFYALLPLVTLVAVRYRTWLAPLLLAGVGAVMVAVGQVSYPVVAFVPGIVAAELMVRERPRRWLASKAPLLFAGSIVAMVVWALLDDHERIGVISRPTALSSLSWVVLSALFFGVLFAPAPRLLAAPPMRFLGTISYSIYLFHGFVLFGVVRGLSTFVSVGAWGELAYLLLVAACAAITVPLATLAFALCERPSIGVGTATRVDRVRAVGKPAQAKELPRGVGTMERWRSG